MYPYLDFDVQRVMLSVAAVSLSTSMYEHSEADLQCFQPWTG